MMMKGKGYPEHVKATSKGFGNPFKQWDKESYEMPNPKQSTKKASL